MTTSPTAEPPAPEAAPLPPRRGVARLLPADPAVRRLAPSTLVNALGNGLFYSLGALYFTQYVGLGVARVGLGLTLAGAFGVAAAVPAGRAADRFGSRRTLIALNVAEAAGMAGYTLIRGYAAFLVLACLVTMVDRAGSTVRNVLYADALPRETRVAGRARLRTLSNAVMVLGSSLAAVALQADTRAAFVTAILFDSATFLGSALLLTRVPAGRPAPVADAGAAEDGAGEPAARRTALRDGPYLAVSALSAVQSLQFALLEVGLPLWVVRDTQAPKPLAAAVMITNALLVMLFQVRVSQAARTAAAAARACLRAGLLLAVSCVVAALAHGLPPVAASVVLVAAVALQAGGEMLSQAGGWALSYDLADERAMGTYQGVFYAGSAAATMVGPSLVTVTALSHGLAGWLVLAALFALSGLLVPVAVRRARHGTPPAPQGETPEPAGAGAAGV